MPLLARLGRIAAWVAAAVVLALPLLSPGGPISLVKVALQEPVGLTITGSIDGLRSGHAAALRLTLHNAGGHEAVVHYVTAAVEGAGVCPATALAIAPWAGTLTIPAHGAADATLSARLTGSVACPGATWRLRYTSG